MMAREKLYQRIEVLKQEIEEKNHLLARLREELCQMDDRMDEELVDVEEEAIPTTSPFTQLSTLLHKLASLQQKKKRFFLLPFQRHPIALMSELVAQIAETTENHLNEPHPLPMQEFLKRLHAETTKTWNQELYKTKGVELLEEFNRLR